MTGRVLIVDSDQTRRVQAGEWLRGHGCEAFELAPDCIAEVLTRRDRLDLILLSVGSNTDLFHQVASVVQPSGAFIVAFVEPSFSPILRETVLGLNADGFINEDLPKDEWLASIHAFIRQKRAMDALRQRIGPDVPSGAAVTPLRDRLPAVYQDVLCRYEEAVKLALDHRIYKMNEDVFEPFRQIAKQLFLVQATARDAVELHYQTLRKFAPTPNAPKAQAYLEVGRTTIIGLLGDLLTFYRDNLHRVANEKDSSDGPTEPCLKH